MSLSIYQFPLVSELNEGNVVQWMESTRTMYNPLEQARWNQSNIDTLFYAGEQRFINTYFQFYPVNNFQNFQFNLIHQPINMVTGYQRQHRKSINYTPVEGASQSFADDLTKVETYSNTLKKRLEKFSLGCEHSAVSGMCLAQPYLDFRSQDPLNGVLDLKIWSYNSFFMDPFFRDTIELSDCNFIWTQSYLTKEIAKQFFPDKKNLIDTMMGANRSNYSFYFLPENYNSARNNFLILSQVWYQTTRKKPFLYSNKDGLTYEYYGDENEIEDVAKKVGIFEVIEIDVPTWKLAVILNDKCMYSGRNPLKFDRCPFVPIFWNYDPQISQPDLRVRSLTRCMRDIQFLMSRRIILNHDISESSVNTGWKYKENSIGNPDVLKKSGQGENIEVKMGYELSDVEKIIPNAVPPSDMQLAEQLADLIFRVSGVNQELLGMASDTETGIETMLRQGAGLVTLQKYFDQWDMALKQIGVIDKEIIQYNWSAAKIGRILGKEPNLEFQTKIFSQYSVVVSEGLNTSIQQQQQFIQLLKLNEITGGAIPPRFLIDNATIQGKEELIAAIEENQKMQSEMAKQESLLRQAEIESKIQNIQADSVNKYAMAQERKSRSASNEGLFEERLSEIVQNRSLALKHKVDALKTLIETYQIATRQETKEAERQIDFMSEKKLMKEDREKEEARESLDDRNILMHQKIPPPNIEKEQPLPQEVINAFS